MSQDSGNGERLLSQSFSDAVTALVDSASQLVVRVDAERSGSGVAWSQGVVVTANHVVGRSTIPTVTMRGGTEIPAKLLGRDPYLDVASLEIPTSGTHSTVREDTEVRVGQFVLALANASGDGVSATHRTVTSARRNVWGYWEALVENAIVTDVRLNAGYSGGPLVGASGRLLGINVAHFADRSIAVPVEYLEKTVVRLSKGGE